MEVITEYLLMQKKSSIADFIRINIIRNHYHFADRNFIYLANQAYEEKTRNVAEPKQFKISHHFIQDFKKRKRISLR